MSNKNVTFCSRCGGEFRSPDQAKVEVCVFCGHAHVIDVKTTFNGGTLRTKDTEVVATGATGSTVNNEA